jgi:hypothetical protein
VGLAITEDPERAMITAAERPCGESNLTAGVNERPRGRRCEKERVSNTHLKNIEY